MESALTPREIQARIRGGESVAEVAQAAGVPEDNIETYAGPVLAEREHIATMARSAPVRRRTEAASQRVLGDTVADTLAAAGLEAEDLRWDAWRTEDRRWRVEVRWPGADDAEALAHFDFDQRGRFSVAQDEAARVLIDDRPPAASPVPGDPDAEPTVDLHDELAIVRVLQDDTEPPTVLPDVPAARIIKLPSRDTEPDDTDEPDDYSPAELEQVDGVYDIIPNPRNDMDVLYDMLAGFNEDSVRIYTGLTQPVTPAAEQPRRPGRRRPRPEPEAPREAEQQRAPESQQEPEARRDPEAPHGPEAQRQPAPPPESAAPTTPATPPVVPQPPAEPEQDPLVVVPEAAEPAPKPRSRRKRAAVPSWDEIMFGGPTPKKD